MKTYGNIGSDSPHKTYGDERTHDATIEPKASWSLL